MPAHGRKPSSSPRSGSGVFARLGKRQTIAIGAALVIIIGVVVGIVVASGGGKKTPVASHSTTTAVPALSTTDCPLTDTPAPNGAVPQRPALLVKIGNEPDGARPQSGLNEADIVYDTPAEGFIMRYVAVFQCNNVSSIGPIRSVRWVDYKMIARTFIDPILAFAGGIDQNQEGVANDSSWLSAANLLGAAQSAGTRITSRVAPDNLYTNTTALYSLFKTKTQPPKPIFTYSSSTSKDASPAASLAINFSAGTDVVWNWSASQGVWLHTYSGTPDIDALTGKQVSTTNIVVQIVKYRIGPYIESTGGTGDVESQLIGTGTGYILRNGTSVKVTWHRSNELADTTYTDASGKTVSLAPGRTWVEIVPQGQSVSITK